MKTIELKPACKDYLWGGERLREDYGIQSDLHPLAEAWVLSCHPDGPSVVASGPYQGKTFPAYIEAVGRECLGEDCRAFDEFPILIKLIDAKNDLSIQVHPSDDYALTHEHQLGKTEAWYVLDCDEGATLYYGFQHQIPKEELARRAKDGTLPEVLNAVPVEKGDLFFIPSGTIHAIRKGILVAEIQENSNVTYRVYDYGRVGADGKPRALHLDKALDVASCTPPAAAPDFGGHLAQCRYFTVDKAVGSFQGVCDERSFTSLLVVEGTGVLREGAEEMSLHKGQSIFIPAGTGAYTVEGDTLQCLVTRV